MKLELNEAHNPASRGGVPPQPPSASSPCGRRGGSAACLRPPSPGRTYFGRTQGVPGPWKSTIHHPERTDEEAEAQLVPGPLRSVSGRGSRPGRPPPPPPSRCPTLLRHRVLWAPQQPHEHFPTRPGPVPARGSHRKNALRSTTEGGTPSLAQQTLAAYPLWTVRTATGSQTAWTARRRSPGRDHLPPSPQSPTPNSIPPRPRDLLPARPPHPGGRVLHTRAPPSPGDWLLLSTSMSWSTRPAPVLSLPQPG